MNILFCDNPLDGKSVDPDFESEATAANDNGFTVHLFSFEMLTDSNADAAIRRIKSAGHLQPMMYRGWMLKPNQYEALYHALLKKNFRLINSPTEYQNCHYLPNSYRFIKGHTPESVWMPVALQQIDYDRLFQLISPFGTSPVIVKDFVKSQKHYWDTACYIPSAADRPAVKSVVDNFISLRGADLNEGLVIRAFVVLNDLAIHSKSGMPLKQEYRLFFLQKGLLGCYNYWEEGKYAAQENLPLPYFEHIADGIESNFFSMDVAKTESGEWIIIELGDGQVAGLPDDTDKQTFYRMVKQFCSSTDSDAN